MQNIQDMKLSRCRLSVDIFVCMIQNARNVRRWHLYLGSHVDACTQEDAREHARSCTHLYMRARTSAHMNIDETLTKADVRTHTLKGSHAQVHGHHTKIMKSTHRQKHMRMEFCHV